MAKHPAVGEPAVVGVDDEIKGLIPIGLVVLKKGEWENSILRDKDLYFFSYNFL